jgi:aquaporin Z
MAEKPFSVSPYLAEFIATFALTFIGVGATITSNAILHATSGEALLNIALAHGLVLAIMVTAVGHISGGHVNPAVTFGFLVTRRIAVLVGIGYIIAQLLGAIAAAWGLTLLFPHWGDATLGTPALNAALGIGPLHGLIIEAILTFFLVLTVFATAVDSRAPKNVYGFAIGLVLTMDILAGGPLTGAAMNPARAFGPTLVSGFWAHHWVYWVGPLLGGGIAAPVYNYLLMPRTTEQ